MNTLEKRIADERERRVLRIMHTCIHFTGIQHDKCEAGINYHEQFGTGVGCFAHIPCTSDESPKSCPLVTYPNRTEAEAEETKREALTRRTLKALGAAHNHAKAAGLGKGHGGVGEMDCPICCPIPGTGGTLQYSVSAYNGYMHARCTTPGCVSWME
jgi:hypothetical protein